MRLLGWFRRSKTSALLGGDTVSFVPGTSVRLIGSSRLVLGRADFERLVAGDVVDLADGTEMILNDLGFAGMRRAIHRAEEFAELVENTAPRNGGSS